MNTMFRKALCSFALVIAFMVILLGGAVNQTFRPWAGGLLLASIPLYLLFVNNHLKRQQASDTEKNHLWTIAVIASLTFLSIGLMFLLFSTPWEEPLAECMKNLLSIPNQFNEFEKYTVICVAGLLLWGLVAGVRRLYRLFDK